MHAHTASFKVSPGKEAHGNLEATASRTYSGRRGGSSVSERHRVGCGDLCHVLPPRPLSAKDRLLWGLEVLSASSLQLCPFWACLTAESFHSSEPGMTVA